MTDHEFAHGDRTIHYRQTLLPVAELDRFRVSETARTALCTPCPVYTKCWSCPGQNSGYDAYNPGHERCMVYLFWTETGAVPPGGDPFATVLEAYASVASYATHHGRMLEQRLGGKEMIDGRCAVCRVCTAAESPPRPCAYPEDQRSSLEALGINVGRLSREVFDHPLRWYRRGGRVPAYVSVLHGLLTDVDEVREVIHDPDVGPRAQTWLEQWIADAPSAH